MKIMFDLPFKRLISQKECRSLICSIPKSGTYLLSEVLHNLGVVKSHLHVSRSEFSDYRDGTLADYRCRPEKFRRECDYELPLRSLAHNGHAVSHLSCEDEVRDICHNLGIKVLFLYRDLRDCVISYMRFLASTGRDASTTAEWIKVPDGPDRLLYFLQIYGWLVKAAEPISAWRTDKDALSVQFEALVGDYGASIQLKIVNSICGHLNIHATDTDKKAALRKSVHMNTITWSGSRTQRSLYWSDEAERQFEALGGADINRSLGYI